MADEELVEALRERIGRDRFVLFILSSAGLNLQPLRDRMEAAQRLLDLLEVTELETH